jgi:iron(III) transport system permease protein
MMRRPPWALRGLAAISAVAFATPILWLALGPPDVLADVIGDRRLLTPLSHTVMLAAATATIAGAIGTALAWLVARSTLPGRSILRVLAPLPLIIPSYVGALALRSGVSVGGLTDELGIGSLDWQGFWPSALVMGMLTAPLVYLPAVARLGQIPRSLHDAAQVMGRGRLHRALSIDVTLAASAIAGGMLLVALYAISEFGAVQALGYSTLTTELNNSVFLDPPRARAVGLVLAMLAVLVVVGERMAQRRLARFQLPTGARADRIALGRWAAPIWIAAASVLAVSLVLPVAVLGWWATRGRGSALSGQVSSLPDAITSSAWLGIAAAVVAVVVVLPLASLVGRYRSGIGAVATVVCIGAFAIPGLAVALSLVRLSVGTAVYQTASVLIAAYVLHFGGQALRTATDAVRTVPARLHEAAGLLGAGGVRRWWTIELPLIAPGLAAAAGLVFVASVKELPATLLLAPTGTVTLAQRVWVTTRDAFFAEAGITALMLLAVAGPLTWLLTLRTAARTAESP